MRPSASAPPPTPPFARTLLLFRGRWSFAGFSSLCLVFEQIFDVVNIDRLDDVFVNFLDEREMVVGRRGLILPLVGRVSVFRAGIGRF